MQLWTIRRRRTGVLAVENAMRFPPRTPLPTSSTASSFIMVTNTSRINIQGAGGEGPEAAAPIDGSAPARLPSSPYLSPVKGEGLSVITRRQVLAASAALPLFGIISRRGSAARPKYRFKFAGNLPMTHPINQRVKEVLPKIME